MPEDGASNDYQQAQAEAKAAVARARALRPWYRKKRYILGGPLAALFLLSAIGNAIDPDKTGSSTSQLAATSESSATAQSASTRAPASVATPRATATPASPKLLYDFACRVDSRIGFAYIEGTVTNTTSAPLQNVTAVAFWATETGQFITSDTALVEYNPLLAGQTSPYKTITRYNPAMSKCRVEFKELIGGTISSERRTP